MVVKIQTFLTTVWNEFIYGGHVLGFGAISIAYSFSVILNFPIKWNSLVVVYLGTYIVYLYDRYKDIKKENIINLGKSLYFQRFYINNTPLIIFISMLIIFSLQLFPEIRLSALIFSFTTILLGIFYSIYFKKITKKLIAFKNFFVPLMWSFLIIFIILFHSYKFSLAIVFFIFFMYLRIFIGVSFSDIKDISKDKKENIKTMVIIFGEQNFFQILNILNTITALIILLAVIMGLFPVFSLILIFTCFYAFVYIQMAKRKKIDIFSLTCNMVYFENLFWAPLIFLARNL